MRMKQLCTLAALTVCVAAGGAQAQYLPQPGNRNTIPNESGKDQGFRIRRKEISGTVKSLDAEKKKLVVQTGKGSKTKDVPVDVGPSLIRAGKGGATFADIRSGDKITVLGEVTIQGGLRAMEITLPKERMSIPPPEKPKKTAKKKSNKDAAKDAGKDAAKAEAAKKEDGK